MAPIQVAPENGETFTLTGTGTLTLTPAQREARILSISIEKIRLSPKIDYFNFRLPEPSSWWGYLQLVRNDTIEETMELLYRRQSVLKIDHYDLDPTEQLRCLIKDSTLLLFDNLTKVGISSGLDPIPFGVDRANYILKNSQPRLIPTLSTTAIYYEIPAIYAAQISIIWQGYALPCENLSGNQALPPPRSPAKGESGNNGSGGGGTRPALPPPPERKTDPQSDSPAPPPDSPQGPPSPTPAPTPPPQGNYVITVQYIRGFRPVFGGPCNAIVDTATRQLLNNSGPGSVINTSTNPTTLSYSIIDRNGQVVTFLTSGNADPNGCPPQIVSVTNVPI